ncbi:ABC transporter substrate-binding protein [Nitrococcus mobilis]|uniref:Putative periplasmic transport protein n=1 Tax=Nitrococcus mobilis Nb-231 TaxID=314278 RepID=A4BQG8_9GAMM|nr:ABC transporter substrate-binding protein [Nitrococcus mobilis]EAR21818.1 putative periplasmic transport protein [Nitrococcus mobilis Nb-231]
MLRRIFANSVAAKRVVLGAVLFWLSLAVAAEQSPAAVVVVTDLQQKLVAVWRSNMDFEQRFEALASPIEASHDLASMARFALGSQWQGLSAAQREQFLATFQRLTIATYADRFDEYDGERFVQSGQRRLAEGKSLVHTKLLLSDGAQIRLDYLLYLQDGQWRIINVLANGVSELAIKRSEYTAFIRDHGFAALIEELQRKTSQLVDERQTARTRTSGSIGCRLIRA